MENEQQKSGNGVLGLIGRVTDAAQGLQVTVKAQRQFQRVETRLLKGLQLRLDRVAGASAKSASKSSGRRASAPVQARYIAIPSAHESPAALMQALLLRSQEQTWEEARTDLFAALLRGMVPDEARILSTLASGKVYPLVHVGIGSPIGAVSRYLVENVSCIGKAAGLTLPQMTPAYLSRLRVMGLVEFGPEDERAAELYKLTEADEQVLEASRRAGQGGRFKTRIVRRSVRISDLGQQLWKASQVPP